MWFLLDDLRQIDCDFVARTYDDGISLYEAHHAEITHLVLDNDLGCEKEGRHFLDWVLEKGWAPSQVTVVSSNSAAHVYIHLALTNAGYHTIDRRRYRLR